MVSGAHVVDVDGSYLFKKHQSLTDAGAQIAPLGISDVPMIGWEPVDAKNFKSMSEKIPRVTPGKRCSFMTCAVCQQISFDPGLLYTYLAEGSGNTAGKGAFRALQRGFTHWSSGRMDHLEINVKHPHFCHMRCQMMPSMKPGIYHVTLLLGRNGSFTVIRNASCECAAG